MRPSRPSTGKQPVDFDLFSACVFCASSFLASDLRPMPGVSGEISGGYATSQRRLTLPYGDQSDVTLRFVAASVRWIPSGSLTEGTPATEVRATVMFPNAHAESVEEGGAERVLGTGSGRFENFSLIARGAVSKILSVEGGAMQRRYKGTDLVNIGGPLFSFTEERQVVADRIDYTLGGRLRPEGARWKGFELAVRWEHSVVQGKYSTAATLTNALGVLDGAAVELRLSRGAWSASMKGQRVAGTLPRSARALPSYDGIDGRAQAFLGSARLAVSRSFGRYDVLVALIAEQTQLPFVALSPLGQETRAFDSGFVAESRTRELAVEFAVRLRLQGGTSPLFFFRSSSGSETVDLTRAVGEGQGQRIDAQRGGYSPFGMSPRWSGLFGLSVAFGLGEGRHLSPAAGP